MKKDSFEKKLFFAVTSVLLAKALVKIDFGDSVDDWATKRNFFEAINLKNYVTKNAPHIFMSPNDVWHRIYEQSIQNEFRVYDGFDRVLLIGTNRGLHKECSNCSSVNFSEISSGNTGLYAYFSSDINTIVTRPKGRPSEYDRFNKALIECTKPKTLDWDSINYYVFSKSCKQCGGVLNVRFGQPKRSQILLPIDLRKFGCGGNAITDDMDHTKKFSDECAQNLIRYMRSITILPILKITSDDCTSKYHLTSCIYYNGQHYCTISLVQNGVMQYDGMLNTKTSFHQMLIGAAVECLCQTIHPYRNFIPGTDTPPYVLQSLLYTREDVFAKMDYVSDNTIAPSKVSTWYEDMGLYVVLPRGAWLNKHHHSEFYLLTTAFSILGISYEPFPLFFESIIRYYLDLDDDPGITLEELYKRSEMHQIVLFACHQLFQVSITWFCSDGSTIEYLSAEVNAHVWISAKVGILAHIESPMQFDSKEILNIEDDSLNHLYEHITELVVRDEKLVAACEGNQCNCIIRKTRRRTISSEFLCKPGSACHNQSVGCECSMVCLCNECNQLCMWQLGFNDIPVFVKKTKGMYGLFAANPISQGYPICAYYGEVLNFEKFTKLKNSGQCTDYVFQYKNKSNQKVCINSHRKGTFSRFSNYSHRPNSVMKITNWSGISIPILYVGDDHTGIAFMEEITFDYKWKTTTAIQCLCGEVGCNNIIGEVVAP